MPDITMCQNENCPMSWNCRRFTAEPSEMQSYSDFEPDIRGNCDFYLPVDGIKRTDGERSAFDSFIN